MLLKEIKIEFELLNQKYITRLDNIVNQLDTIPEGEVIQLITEGKASFEYLMGQANAIGEEMQDGIYLKDVQYRLLDGLFLWSDLYNYYQEKLIDRFKLRFMNYVKKDSVSKLIMK